MIAKDKGIRFEILSQTSDKALRNISRGSAKRPLLSRQSIQSAEIQNPAMVFHVNTVLPKKINKQRMINEKDIFETNDSRAFNSFEKYGMFYSFENPSKSPNRCKILKGTYEYFYKEKARVVVDVNQLSKYTFEQRPSTPHRNKMMKICPKLKILYHLRRDINPQTHANKSHKPDLGIRRLSM